MEKKGQASLAYTVCHSVSQMNLHKLRNQNFRRLVLFCIASLAVVFAFSHGLAASITITAGDANRSIHLRVGQELILKLENNPSTGFSWILDDGKHPGLISLGKPTFTDRASMLGAGGVQSWTFRAAERGLQILKLEYRRPWEHKPPAKTVDFLVVIG